MPREKSDVETQPDDTWQYQTFSLHASTDVDQSVVSRSNGSSFLGFLRELSVVVGVDTVVSG